MAMVVRRCCCCWLRSSRGRHTVSHESAPRGSSPTPSWPRPLCPHASTRPRAVASSVCRAPHAASVTRCPSRMTRSGVDLSERSPVPSCPLALSPHACAPPCASMAMQWQLPHASPQRERPPSSRSSCGASRACVSPHPSWPWPFQPKLKTCEACACWPSLLRRSRMAGLLGSGSVARRSERAKPARRPSEDRRLRPADGALGEQTSCSTSPVADTRAPDLRPTSSETCTSGITRSSATSRSEREDNAMPWFMEERRGLGARGREQPKQALPLLAGGLWPALTHPYKHGSRRDLWASYAKGKQSTPPAGPVVPTAYP